VRDSVRPAAPPREPDNGTKRRAKEFGVLLATSGLLLVSLLALLLRGVGLSEFSLRHWSLSLLMTSTVQTALWLVPRRGWDARLRWDPHFIYVPMAAAALQLNVYVMVVPQARHLLLLIWFVASLFMAGLAGFREMVILSAVMTAGYLAVLNSLIARREVLTLGFEHTFTLAFFVSSVYAAVVFERLRRDRHETKLLRRRLAEMAHTDPLTGLANRRQFEGNLAAALASVERYGGPCSVSLIDIDFFKQYNDAHGHLAGDALLKTLAEVMRSQLRGSDLLARYGGEEFGLIMPGTGKAEGQLTTERLRARVDGYVFADATTQPGGRLTISAGVAAAPQDGMDPQTVLRRADEALYAAKRKGKNRVEPA
jgi:diguanylate cyclase (GGDEF)-like protein